MTNILLYVYNCPSCGGSFKAPELPDTVYGEFLGRTTTGHYTFLNAIEDPHFKEVSRFISSLDIVNNKTKTEIAHILHAIYGSIADRAPDGNILDIHTFQTCLVCKSHSNLRRIPTNPYDFTDVPSMAYKNWDKLNDEEKRDLVADLVKKYLKELDGQ